MLFGYLFIFFNCDHLPSRILNDMCMLREDRTILIKVAINFVIFVRQWSKVVVIEQGLRLLVAQQLKQDQVLCSRVYEQYFFLIGLGGKSAQ